MQEEINQNGNNSFKPISFLDAVLRMHLKNYTLREKETLTIIVGVRKFIHYLEEVYFVIESNHHALCQFPMFNFKLGYLHR